MTTYTIRPDALTDRHELAPLAPEKIRHDADGWHAVYPSETGEPDEQYETVETLLMAHELEADDFDGLAVLLVQATGQASILAQLWRDEELGTYGDGDKGGAEWLSEGLDVPAGVDPGEFFALVEPLFQFTLGE